MNRNVSELQPHPRNVEIYGDHADVDLVESIKTKGVLNPLLITNDGFVISGHRRLDAARQAAINEVPVVIFNSNDELDILEALVESNRQRQKTNEQFAREAQILFDIEEQRAALRHKHTLNNFTKDNTVVMHASPREDYGKTRDKVGQQLGRGGQYVERSVKVVETIDDLKRNGHNDEAEQLRTTLNNGSVRKAYNESRSYQQPKPENTENIVSYVTLEQWKSYDQEKQAQFIESAPRQSTAGFNKQDTDSIEWARWSWNPITGCHTGCKYCYARDIANRFLPQGFEPTFHPDRLYSPFNHQVPVTASENIGYKNIFTCSMADMFGPWVPKEWILAILNVINDTPQWNYLLLTKWPFELLDYTFPPNAWVGTTIDKQSRITEAEEVFHGIDATVKFVSCEPMLEDLEFHDLSVFDWVIIGGRSQTTQQPEFYPPREWVNKLEYDAMAAGCKVYEKSNLLQRIKEYPGKYLKR